MIRVPRSSTPLYSSAASDVYKRQVGLPYDSKAFCAADPATFPIRLKYHPRWSIAIARDAWNGYQPFTPPPPCCPIGEQTTVNRPAVRGLQVNEVPIAQLRNRVLWLD